MTTHPNCVPLGGQDLMSPQSDPGQWANSEHGSTTPYGSAVEKGFQASPDLLKNFSGVQKKVTRDGQPAKRRGPKPDSKPAQTRRQELNRQAQRTHRERKEQYIKALEIELSRLRELYAIDTNNFNTNMDQHKVALHQVRQENAILRDILNSRGIPVENELESRRGAGVLRFQRETSNLSSASQLQGQVYQHGMPGPPSSNGYSPMHGKRYLNGSGMSGSGHSPGTTHHSNSPPGPDVQEQYIKQESQNIPISDMPGIFEKDPQLGVDFILALEATCRDHNEYLVRRSMNSPDDSDDAHISGHVLMASCPPPSHISSTPAQQGGLIPTYPHQAPQIPIASLNMLLNLSQKIQEQGEITGGQVTPIMALQSLRGHRNYRSLTREDVVGMVESIKNKVRCYGFGAVMEDFELRDALSSIFATKPEAYESFENDMTDEIEEMYS